MTQGYLLNCNCFSNQELFLQGMGRLSSFRRKKVNHAKSLQAKYQRLGAGVLLDQALRQRGLSEKEMEYMVDTNGKPFFAHCSNLFFSLSHSGDWAACTLSDQQVGVDVQVLSEYNARVSERCFSKEEAKVLAQLSGEERDREFTRLWVRKESLVKYFGTWKKQETAPKVMDFYDEVHVGVCTEDDSHVSFKRLYINEKEELMIDLFGKM